MKTELHYEIELVSLDDIHDHPRNYLEHPADQTAEIVERIRKFGVYKNVVIARDGTLLAGHGVIKAARQMGFAQFPVIRMELDPEEPSAIALLTGDNEVSHLAVKDSRKLSELLKTVKDSIGLEGTGFTDQMLANLIFVTRPKSEIQDMDEAAEWVGLPDYDPSFESPKLAISFRNPEDRDKLIAMLEIETINGKHGQTWSCWWPTKEREDLSSVRWEGEHDDA